MTSIDNTINTDDITIVGYVNDKVIKTFNLNYPQNKPIFCGESNKTHMKTEHPDAYELYGDKIEEILKNPDFISKHPKKKNSAIEYIKVFHNENDEYVLVAVRATGNNTLFARTLFIMDPEKVDRYTACNALKSYK